MPNICDYLSWRGDVPFSVSPFNEVDGLILSELVYADFSGIILEGEERVPLPEARRRFWQKHKREELLQDTSFTKMAPFLLDDMADNARFGKTEIGFFLDEFDTKADLQLAALTFFLEDGTAFAAFRGTDATVVGWKEDFNMSYQPETEGQRRASAYLDKHFADTDIPLRVGGHSKGGNLAVFAAVKACESVRSRILAVYNNDGPGFLDAFTELDAYREMLPRITCIVPESSIIGTLLSNSAYQHVVKSTSIGILQHDGFTWQVLGPKFVEAEKRSENSVLIEQIMRQWLSGKTEEERRLFVNTLFSLFEATGKDTFVEMMQEKAKSLSSMYKMLETMPKEQRTAVLGMLNGLVVTGSESLYQNTKRSVVQLLENVTAREREKKQEEPT